MRDSLLYIGTYTRHEPHVVGKAEGIYLYAVDTNSGTLTYRGVTTGIINPSFVTTDPANRFLYAVCEIGDHPGERRGWVAAFAIDQTDGSLRLLNQVDSGGSSPCHLRVVGSGSQLLVTNYQTGTVARFFLRADGALGEASDIVQHSGQGPHRGRQDGAHAHSITPDLQERFAVAADLGADELRIYRLDTPAGSLALHRPPVRLHPGAGPRHLAFHPNGRFAYVINELDSTITAFAYDAVGGALTTLATVSTLPADFSAYNLCADIHIHPAGHFLYGSNRGHDSLALFAVDETSGLLSPRGHVPTQGRTPRNFTLGRDARFLFVANQDTDTVVTFALADNGGQLEYRATTAVPTPVCLHPVG